MDFTHMSSLAQQGYGLLIALGIKVVEAIALMDRRPLADRIFRQHDWQGDDAAED